MIKELDSDVAERMQESMNKLAEITRYNIEARDKYNKENKKLSVKMYIFLTGGSWSILGAIFYLIIPMIFASPNREEVKDIATVEINRVEKKIDKSINDQDYIKKDIIELKESTKQLTQASIETNKATLSLNKDVENLISNVKRLSEIKKGGG